MNAPMKSAFANTVGISSLLPSPRLRAINICEAFANPAESMESAM